MNDAVTFADPAVPFMAMDLVTRMLDAVDDPPRLAAQVIQQIRELTGARFAALIQYVPAAPDRYTVLHVSPDRRSHWLRIEAFEKIALSIREMPSVANWTNSETWADYNVTLLVEKDEPRTGIAVPLHSGSDCVGGFVLLDLPDRKTDSILRDSLAPVVRTLGLILKNAQLIRQQEDTIQRRTLALEKSEREKTLILQNITEQFLYVDTHWNILWANQSAIETIGLPAKEIIGRPCYEVRYGGKTPCRDCPVFEVVCTGRPCNRKLTSPDEKVYWISANPILDAEGLVTGVVETILEITQQERTERSLKESEKRLRMALDCAKMGIYDWSPAEDRIAYDRQLEPFWGKETSVACHVTSPQRILARILPEDRPQVQLHYDECLSGKRAAYQCEYRIVDRAGRTRWLYDKGEVIQRDDRGRPTRIIGTIQDFTEKHDLESQLFQSQKMEAVGKLAGGVAHDFNNLLQVILGYGEIIDDQLEPESPIREMMQQVLAASDRAQTLVRQLLAFSRADYAVEHQPIHVDRLILDFQKMVRRVIGEQVELVLHLHAGRSTVQGNPGQLEQVLMNLCVNARDAMPDGGTLRIHTELCLVEASDEHAVAGLPRGRYIRCSVSDTGSGMPPEVCERVFEPFFTTKQVDQGTGLGLSTAYAILQQHKGAIHVESQPGTGTTFKLYLPVAVSEEEIAKTDPRAEKPLFQGNGETILLAEDEPTIRDLNTEILKKAGYRVLAASDSFEAIQLYHRHADEVDLLLLDVMMPRASGRHVYETIAAIRPDIPVVFCTGYTNEWFGENPAGSLLQKPCSQTVLLEYIRKALEEKLGVSN